MHYIGSLVKSLVRTSSSLVIGLCSCKLFAEIDKLRPIEFIIECCRKQCFVEAIAESAIRLRLNVDLKFPIGRKKNID